MNISQLDWTVAKVTLGLVVLLAGVNVLTWTASPPEEKTMEVQRTPAAMVSERVVVPDTIIPPARRQESVFDLKCLGKDLGPLTVASHQIRITGRICDFSDQGQPAFKDIFAFNSTNGFEGTVFKRPNFAFTSDFLFLAEGKNEVVVNGVNSQGETKSSRLIFIRQGTDK